MNIQKVYGTSRGRFWSLDEDQKKEHRQQLASLPGLPAEYEPVREGYVLIADVQTDQGVRGMGTQACVFELSKVEVL